MAALSTYLGTSEATELIPTELIPSFVQGYEFADRVGMAIAWGRPGQGNVPVRFPRMNLLGATSGAGVPAGTKSESDTFTDVLIDFAESTITPGMVGFRLPISDEAVAGVGGIAAVPAGSLAQCLEALADRIDSDTLSSSTSATNSVGTVSRDYTVAEFRSDLATYKTLNIPGAPALVLHHNGMADLLGSIHASTAGLVRGSSSVELGADDGFQGVLHGVSLYESGNVPSESTGHSGLMTPQGTESGYGIVMNEMPNIRPTRGDEAEQRAVTFYVCRAWYGTGLTNPRRCQEVLHQ